MFCPSCGHENSGEASFCGNCGATLDATVEPPPGEAAPSPPKAPPGVSVEERCANCNEELGPGLFCDACGQFTPGQRGVKQASIGRRLGAYVLDAVLVVVTLVIGYIIWWLFTLQWGQTPGKQILGIRAVKVKKGSRWVGG